MATALKASGVCVGATILLALSLTACGTSGVPEASVRGGAVPLTAVHIGTPDHIFQQAIGTFGQDPNGSMGGKTQYLSRMPDENGGQYVVQTKNDRCFEISVLHAAKPISKEVAIKTLRALLPADAPEAKVDDSQLSNAAAPTELFAFGDKFKGQLLYTDKSGKEVKIISASQTAPM